MFSIKWFRDTDEIFSYIATLSEKGRLATQDDKGGKGCKHFFDANS